MPASGDDATATFLDHWISPAGTPPSVHMIEHALMSERTLDGLAAASVIGCSA